MPENESDALNTKVQMYLLPDTSDAGMKETTFVKEKDPKYQQEYVHFKIHFFSVVSPGKPYRL